MELVYLATARNPLQAKILNNLTPHKYSIYVGISSQNESIVSKHEGI